MYIPLNPTPKVHTFSFTQTQGFAREPKSLPAPKFSNLIQGDVQILDARTAEEYAEGHIEGAVLADVKMDNFLEVAQSKLSKDSPVAVYCRSGRRSLTACDILSKDGYKVYNLKTGIIGWQEAGLPIVKDEPARPKPMVGAYTKQRDLTTEELSLFRHTMKDDRYTPISVATQVVSGINYRFFCNGPDGDVVVTIYKPLHDAPRVTEMSK